jgi:hypothetical protein
MSLFDIALNDPTPLFNSDYQHPHFPERNHINIDMKDINPYWIDLMQSHDVEVYRVELFYGPDNFPYVMGIHTDRSYGDWGKINWVVGGAGCQMHWYKPLSANQKEVKATAVHSNYNLFEPEEVKLIYSSVISSPSIVQVGLPHNVTNPGQERWCYSMVMRDLLTDDNVTFGRLKRIFGK